MLQTVIALCLFINGQLVEHRIQDSLSDCLKHKRLVIRNMSMNNKNIQCVETEDEVQTNIDGSKSIKKMLLNK